MKPSRKRHHERRQFAVGQGPAGSDPGGALDVREWREKQRYEALVDFARRSTGLKWGRSLFLFLLEDLFIADEFYEIIGPPEKLPPSRYPQAVALAIALRHSWWPSDLEGIATHVLERRPRT